MTEPTILAKWLRETGRRPAWVARQVGCHRAQMYRIRDGHQRPSPDMAVKLEAVTGIPAWDFVKP